MKTALQVMKPPFLRLFFYFLLLTTHAAALRVVSFELINVPDPSSYRPRLLHNEVLGLTYPFSISAITNGSGVVRHVTFTQPIKHREYFSPYVLRGDNRNGTFSPISLPDGYHKVSAYVNNNPHDSYSIRFRLSSTKEDAGVFGQLPSQGPSSDTITPNLNGRRDVPPPKRSSSCSIRVPQITLQSAFSSSYYDNTLATEYSVNWCSGPDDKLRIRALRYLSDLSSGQEVVQTLVISQKMESSFTSTKNQDVLHRCKAMYIFYEACVMEGDKEMGKNTCSTSRLVRVPPRDVPEPRLSYRPPIFVDLAPGDSISIRTEFVKLMGTISTDAATQGFANGGFEGTIENYTIRGVVEDADGKELEMKSTNKKYAVTQFPPRAGGATEKDNGSMLSVKYWKKKCRSGEGTTLSRYATRIHVNNKNKRLIRQDDELPTFETPAYPETEAEQPVELMVNAANPGGGRREGGEATELHYQWYLRISDFLWFTRTYAEPIYGATSATLRIEKAKCSSGAGCGRRGCFKSLRAYYVDVCNTYGCRRSAQIDPNVVEPKILPPGTVYDEFTCSIV